MLNHELSLAGRSLALKLHGEQQRKYWGTPYWEHPIRVAEAMAKLPYATPILIATSSCHDIGEDCLDKILSARRVITSNDSTLASDIAHLLYAELPAGCVTTWADLEEVGRNVVLLSNPSRNKSSLSRAERKKIDREHISSLGFELKSIKMLDRIDNFTDLAKASAIDDRAASFKELYREESILLAQAMEVRGNYDRDLMTRLNGILCFL
jgi:hypothetical protein